MLTATSPNNRYPTRGSEPHCRLHADTRGALLVVGIVLGALLVGALYYLASIGDAMVWREEAQNAADAGALSNAIWHARGMNMIVGINIVMSLVLSLLVVWRLVLVIIAIVSILLAVFGGVSLEVLADVILADFNYIGPIFQLILSAMNAEEIAVATLAPPTALELANGTTNEGYHVDTATYSLSMLPNFNIASVTSLACFTAPVGGGAAASSLKQAGKEIAEKTFKSMFKDKSGIAQNNGLELAKLAQNSEQLSVLGITGKMGLGFSLPVQTDAYATLCKKSFEFWPRQLGAEYQKLSGGSPPKVFEALGPLKAPVMSAFGLQSELDKWATEMVEKMFNNPALGAVASIVFCVPIGTTVSEFLNGIWNIVQHANIDAADQDKSMGPKGPLGIIARPFIHDYNTMKNTLTLVLDTSKAWDNLLYQLKAPSDDTQCGTPAVVWDAAANGSAYLRSMAVVVKPTRLAATDAGLQIADGARTANLVGAEGHPIWAHAEMYFDCTQNWAVCRANAMWQMRWTARLRRVQPFGELLAYAESNQPGDASAGIAVATGDWAAKSSSLRVFTQWVGSLLGGALGRLAGGEMGGIVGAAEGISYDRAIPPLESTKLSETSTLSAVSGWSAERLLGQSPGESIGEFLRKNADRNSAIH